MDLLVVGSLNPGTSRATEPQIAGNLKAIRRGFWNFFFGVGFAATKAAAIAAYAAGKDGGKLLKPLLGSQIRLGRFRHSDRLLNEATYRLCMLENGGVSASAI